MNSDDTPAAEIVPLEHPGDRLLSHNARLGIVMFTIYFVIYVGFMAISAFAPQLMSHTVDSLGGVNIAIIYGMFLIISAFVLALVYMVLCKAEAAAPAEVNP